MKTHETIRLNFAATVAAGLLSSFMLFVFIGLPELAKSGNITPTHQVLLRLTVLASPIIVALMAAFVQYRFIMKPWHKALGELLGKALNLQEKSAQETTVPRGGELRALKQSIEVATEQFKEARLREKALIQHAVDVICVIDLKCKILSVNPASLSVWGYKPEELIGRQITDFLVSDDVKNTMKAIVGAEKSIDKVYFENRFQKKNGELVDLLWAAHLSASDRGLFCIAHDITERKRAEAILRESEERVRGILQDLPAGVCVIGQEGKIAFMNRTAHELTGFSEGQIENLKAQELFSFFKEGDAVLAGEAGAGFDCQISRSTGERFPAEASIRSFRWGKSKASLCIFLDATMKHEIERAKREFVAMVSHDLRTPLTAIALIFSYLHDGLGGELTEDGKEFTRQGQSSCERLMTLVQDLLDLEKMRAGKFIMEKIDTSMLDVVDAAVEAVEPYADSHGIKLSVDCPNVKVVCDGGRIIQVLINLISNAVKFSAQDGIVTLKVKDDPQALTFIVSNFGRIIPEDKLSSIFEKFEQANAGAAEERKGTGLGLTISKTIVEQHGGKIWAQSSEMEGTRFFFTLPKAP